MARSLSLAAGVGLILWAVTTYLSGRAEAWDAPMFWSRAYPIALLLAAGIGWAFPRRAWLVGGVIVWMLVPVMLTGPTGLSMLPPGLVLVAILSLPAMLAGALGARIGRRRGGA